MSDAYDYFRNLDGVRIYVPKELNHFMYDMLNEWRYCHVSG